MLTNTRFSCSKNIHKIMTKCNLAKDISFNQKYDNSQQHVV